jgi:hypothetical protein
VALENASRHVNVNSPHSVGNVIRINGRISNVLLAQDIVTQQAPGFTLLRPKADKIECVIPGV